MPTPPSIGNPHRAAAEHAVPFLQPLVRLFQKAVAEPEFIHHLQGRGMNCVAAKVAEEVRVLFQHHDIDAGTPEEIAPHHVGRPAADDDLLLHLLRRTHNIHLTSRPVSRCSRRARNGSYQQRKSPGNGRGFRAGSMTAISSALSAAHRTCS
jgi:hypothetical protein